MYIYILYTHDYVYLIMHLYQTQLHIRCTSNTKVYQHIFTSFNKKILTLWTLFVLKINPWNTEVLSRVAYIKKKPLVFGSMSSMVMQVGLKAPEPVQPQVRIIATWWVSVEDVGPEPLFCFFLGGKFGGPNSWGQTKTATFIDVAR